MPQVVQYSIQDNILDLVMRLFWEKGLFNTSIDDIVEKTGLNRAAIYKYFGGKQALFIQMLKRYRQKITLQFTAPLQKKAMGLDAINAFFEQFLHLDKKGMPCGCFLIATASDMPSHDEEVAEFISLFSKDLRALFLACLVYAVKNEQIKTRVNTKAVADFLVANVFGLMTLHRTQATTTTIKNHIAMVRCFLNTVVKNQFQHGNQPHD